MVVKLIRAVIVVVAILNWNISRSQSVSPLTTSEHFFKEGLELIDKSNFSAARQSFERYLENNQNGLLRADAEYYIAYCAINLYQDDAESLYDDFIREHPNHPRAESAYLELANFYYHEKNYQKAVQFYSRVNFQNLDGTKKEEAYFRAGYANFATRNFAETSRYFNSIKRQSGKYSPAANYYSAYSEFQSGDFSSALEDLLRIENEPSYQSQVPHMLISTYYKLNRFSDAVEYGEKMLSGENRLGQLSEIYLVMGDSYFSLAQYPQASEYFSLYQENNSSGLDREVQFKIGYSHFQAGKEEEAAEALKQVAISDEPSGYLASYYLGIIYAHQKNFEFATSSFEKARKYKEDPKIAEESLFQLSKINFETDNSTQSVVQLNQFIKEYPSSDHIKEANELLSRALLNSSNYDQAIAHIEKLSSMSREVARVYQKATFLKGVELFNKRDFPEAVNYWNKSLEYPYDDLTVLESNFWKGEAFSIGRRFDQAIESYMKVLGGTLVPADLKLEAHYGIAYAYYNNKDYAKALLHFKEYVRSGNTTTVNYPDAQLRLADCYYVAKSYQEALSLYARAIQSGPDKAYAYLQTGIIQGILNNVPMAKSNLEKVVNDYSKSRYLDDALFERALVDFERGNNSEAITWFTRLINAVPESKYIPFAVQRRAIANFNLKQYDATIDDYKLFLKEFPNHKEANSVLLGLQDALSVENRTSEFQEFLDQFKAANPERSGLQGVEYQAAKNLYFNQDYEKAILRLKMFIDAYPEDDNVQEAKYYLAESYYRLNNSDEALTYYNQLLNDRTFPQISRVIQRIGELEYAAGRLDNAIYFYHELLKVASNKRQQYLAWSGMMEAFYNKAQYDSCEYYAQTILDRGAASSDGNNKALLYLGKSAYARGDYDKAKDYFLTNLNSAKDEYGAEAQYLLAEVLNLEQQYQQSNEALYDLHKNFSAYQLWYDKSFLLIAENFLAMGETFQATQTLQSLIDNSKLTFIVNQAESRLNDILAKQQGDSTVVDTTNIEKKNDDK